MVVDGTGPTDMQRRGEDGASLSEAYIYLQRIVGTIAITLPFVVAGGDALFGDSGLRGSISAYYYGRTGGYFVGSLFALAMFFLSYDYRPREQRSIDNKLSNVASAAAIGVALLPTPSNGSLATGSAKVIGTLHLVSAGTLFGLLAIFSLYHFTKTGGEVTATTTWGDRLRRIFVTQPAHLDKMSAQKRRRNRIFRVCGWIIVACIVLILVSNAFGWKLLFWLESVAVVAFGFSWLVKGGAVWFLNDPVEAEGPPATT